MRTLRYLLVGGLLGAATVAAAPAPVQVGDSVPDVALPSIDGADHILSDAVAEGPVVLVLYRGVW